MMNFAMFPDATVALIPAADLTVAFAVAVVAVAAGLAAIVARVAREERAAHAAARAAVLAPAALSLPRAA